MKNVCCCLFLLSSSAFAGTEDYYITTSILHNGQTLSSHHFQISPNHMQTNSSSTCAYTLHLSKQSNDLIDIESEIHCGEYSFYPSFTFSSNGDAGSLEFDWDTEKWTFTVNATPNTQNIN